MIGMRVSVRVRMSSRDAHYAGELVDGARMLGLFGDLATELMIRLDGDEGLFRAYEQIEFLAPVFAGDYVEATAELVRVGDTSRQMRFEARKVITNVRGAGLPASAADVLAEPVVVCRAVGTCVTPKEVQRRPKQLYMPALPAGPSPGEGAIVTPPESDFSEVILTAALAGTGSPRSIADDAARCREAGAAVVHLHARRTEGASREPKERLGEIVAAIRERCDCVVELATGGAAGMSLDERVQPLAFRPELATLICGSVNVGDDVLANGRPQIRDLAARIRKAGSVPTLECYEVGHVEEAFLLLKEEAIGRPLHFQLVLGAPGSMGAREENVQYVRSMIPSESTWAVAARGRLQQPMTELAMRLGGHARVGDEDDPSPPKDASAPLVTRAAQYARTIGRAPVEPDRARTLLGIRPRNGA